MHSLVRLRPKHLRARLAIKLIGVFALASVAWGASIYAIWGPLWPVEPTFSPTSPSSETPFDIPFTVENKSALFSIEELFITCRIISLNTKENKQVLHSHVTIPVTSIERLQSRRYVCPYNWILNSKGDTITEALIELHGEYRSSWPLFIKGTANSGLFSWNISPGLPHWSAGMPAQ